MRTPGRAGSFASLLTVAVLAAATAAPDPLLDAAARGDVEAVRSLLSGGADPDVALGDGLTALHIAAEEGNVEMARLLVDRGADAEARTRIGSYTPLHLAAGNAHVGVVEVLFDAGADVAAVTTNSGATPLHLAARAMAGERVVRELLGHGAPVDARESAAGQTALMFAASYGRVGSVRQLLQHGADPGLRTEVVDVLRNVALDRAAEDRLKEAATTIRQNAPEGTDHTLTAAEVQAAIVAQRELLRSGEQVGKVLEGFHPDDLINRGEYWNTPSGFESVEQVDLRPRWETWVGKTGGMTALLHAAREGHVAVVEALLDGGADIDR